MKDASCAHNDAFRRRVNLPRNSITPILHLS
jgi:hypothetical protein